MKLEKSVVIFDLETTAKETWKAEIVEFAAIKINPDGSREELEFLCKPNNLIPQEVIEIHGITNEQVSDAPSFKKMSKEVKDFFNDADVAGFNVNRYDVKVLDRHMEEAGIKGFFEKRNVYDAYPVFCTHASRKLKDAVKFYTGKDAEDQHEAMGDVKSVLAVIEKQVEREGTSFAELAAKNSEECKKREERDNPLEKFFITVDNNIVINFTKHKGKTLDSMDNGFIKWMLSQDWIPKEAKDFLKEAVKKKNLSKRKK